ncbi:MAG TPA: single-stranded DNA-binding protein [Patescibacteria group bacterium]|nr:single-stranded DNA-binding protein [Patescibacteria group bacterium]
MARSLNKVQLIGNLTRDPELRYTPTGTAVCSFSLATNRSWTTDTGEKKEETDFHRIVAWNKLAELCSQLLSKGRKAYVEGRLANREYTAQDGSKKQVSEIILEDMLVLDSKRTEGSGEEMHSAPAPAKKPEVAKIEEPVAEEMSSEEIADDIPF